MAKIDISYFLQCKVVEFDELLSVCLCGIVCISCVHIALLHCSNSASSSKATGYKFTGFWFRLRQILCRIQLTMLLYILVTSFPYVLSDCPHERANMISYQPLRFTAAQSHSADRSLICTGHITGSPLFICILSAWLAPQKHHGCISWDWQILPFYVS